MQCYIRQIDILHYDPVQFYFVFIDNTLQTRACAFVNKERLLSVELVERSVIK